MAGWKRKAGLLCAVALVSVCASVAQLAKEAEAGLRPVQPQPSIGKSAIQNGAPGKELIVYVQQPVFGKRTLKVGMLNYGHAFLGIRDPITGFEQKFGFYPDGKAMLMWHGRSGGAVHSDEDATWDVRKAYRVSEEDARRLMMSISTQLPSGKAPGFDMKKYNCSTWVLNEARIAGVEVQTKQRCKDKVCVNVPADLGQDLMENGGEVNSNH